jgi:DNA-binding Xre family transcriptional regulator
MKTKKVTRKLSLRKETISSLEMGKTKGGTFETLYFSCIITNCTYCVPPTRIISICFC